LTWGPSGQECDEVVGRFCLTYDSGSLPKPTPEAPRVTDARRFAIEALRRAFSYEADRLETSGPLVRYLVEDERASEAVSAARTFAALSRDSIWSSLLLGFALHAAADDTAAERLFGAALTRLTPDDAERIRDLDWLLSSRDRSVIKKLSAAEQEAARQRVWRFADPLYLTPGNEHWAEHVSRHVWSRILAMAPVVRDMVRWGRDLEQLTVRYGVPTAKSRTWGSVGSEGSLIEHYDPAQLAYIPEDLLDLGVPPAPLPGEAWQLENPRSRSGHAPRTVRRLVPLPHQVTRFPETGGTKVRFDAELVLDSAAAGNTRFTAGLWILDALLNELSAQRRDGAAVRDTLRFHFEAAVPAGDHVYSLEALESETDFAARARYALDVTPAASGLRVSDPLLAHPFGSTPPPRDRNDPVIRPYSLLSFARGQSVGIYAEIHGLSEGSADAGYSVELSVRKADRGSVPARLAGWLGRRLGISSPTPPPRLAWSAQAPVSSSVPIAVDLKLDGLDRGFHVLVLEVTDLRNNSRSESRKIIRIE
jgi:hypothetical protein